MSVTITPATTFDQLLQHWTLRNLVHRGIGAETCTDLQADVVARRDVENLARPGEPTMLFLNAHDDGRLVGRGRAVAVLDRAPVDAFIEIEVLPSHRRIGLGTELLSRLERFLAGIDGVTRVTGEIVHGGGPDTEAGAAGEDLAHRHGYRAYLRHAIRELALPQAWPERRPGGYRIDVHRGTPHDAWLDGLCVMMQHMDTDVPHGDLEASVRTWTHERVLAEYDDGGGRTTFWIGAAFDGADQMAGFCQLSSTLRADGSHDGQLWQGSTLVLPEHRGHGLGEALKRTTLAQAAADDPLIRFTRTRNALTNTHMNRINDALGYRTTGTTVDVVKPVRGSAAS